MTFDIEYEKFTNHILKLWFKDNNKKRLIRGSFRQEGSDEVFEGDEFMAYEIQNKDALGTYETYIKYFNYTLRPNEKKRIAVNAEWIIEKGALGMEDKDEGN